MDDIQFDRIAKVLAETCSRRAGLSFLLAAAVSFAMAADSTTSAKKKPICKGEKKRCGKKCRAIKNDPKNCGACNRRCAAGETCSGGVCFGAGTCPVGANVCGATPFNDICNGSSGCFCFQTVTGQTRCGVSVSGCGTCLTNQDCVAEGTGSVCALAPVAACNCSAGQRFCIAPCPR